MSVHPTRNHRSSAEILVSVVVPCYNVEDCVEATVVSALEQTCSPHEVICVDDGSSDGTVEILQRLRAMDGRVHVVQGAHAGAPAARNKGLAVASGEYVQFLDADDVLDAEKVAGQIALAERTDADLVVGAYRYQNAAGRTTTYPVNPGEPWVLLLQKRLGITSSNLWRRAALEAAGGWNEALASSQEADLMARLLANGAAVTFDPALHTTVYGRGGSISDGFPKANRERYVRVRADVLLHCEAHGLLVGDDLTAAREAMFNSIRMLAVSDRPAAHAFYRQSLPPGYVPPVSEHNTRPYVVALRLVGFRGAERLRQLSRRGA